MFSSSLGVGLMGGLMQTVQAIGSNIGNIVAPLPEDIDIFGEEANEGDKVEPDELLVESPIESEKDGRSVVDSDIEYNSFQSISLSSTPSDHEKWIEQNHDRIVSAPPVPIQIVDNVEFDDRNATPLKETDETHSSDSPLWNDGEIRSQNADGFSENAFFVIDQYHIYHIYTFKKIIFSL